MVDKENLEKLSVPIRLRHYEELIREASRLCRNEILNAKREQPEMILQNLITCGRIVATNNFRLAKRLVSESAFFFARIYVDKDNVFLFDPSSFNSEYATAKRDCLQNDSDSFVKSPTGKQHRLQAITRLSLLWRSRFPTLGLKAILRKDGTVTSKPAGIAREMSSSWFSVFGIARKAAPEALDFLATTPTWCGASGTAPPSRDNIRKVIEVLAKKHTACGPNGIPYHAWAALIELSSQILFNVNLHIFEHGFVDTHFNEQMCFYT